MIKIGVAGALKTPYGIASLRGAEMAAKEINDAGGVLGSNIQLFSAHSEATAFQEQPAKLQINIIFHGTTSIKTGDMMIPPWRVKSGRKSKS